MGIRQVFEARAQRAIERFLGIETLYGLCRTLSLTPETFSAKILDAMQIRTEWSGLPHSEIPATGPLLVVANHPYGLIEGLALDTLVLGRRSDVKVMVWHMVAKLPGLRDRGIYVDPLRLRDNRKLNIQGFRKAIDLLTRGGALMVFPAGKVARFTWSQRAIVDPPWNPHIARLARRTKAAVLPVYFHGHNGLPFQLAALMLPTLHQSLIVREVNNKRGSILRATIGQLVPPEDVEQFGTDEEAIEFLRLRTESLAASTR